MNGPIVTIVLRRQTGFHSITTFAQTLVILLVAFVTFFFNIRNFSDRIMVNLILLLILSTLSSSSQSGVPKTSYYKMIDIWFLFLLILIVLTIIGHTVITVLLGSESAENKIFGNHRRLFSRRGSLKKFVKLLVVLLIPWVFYHASISVRSAVKGRLFSESMMHFSQFPKIVLKTILKKRFWQCIVFRVKIQILG